MIRIPRSGIDKPPGSVVLLPKPLDRHGTQAFLVLILLGVMGVPVFGFLTGLADSLLPLLILV